MQLYELTAWELADKLQAREVSAVEATQACLDRITAVEDRVKAYLTLTADQALQQAREVDAARGRGEDLPATAGVPIAHKDLLCTDGVRTTCASKILDNFVPPYNATVVERCHAAGLPMLGKANMDEFAMGSSTENSAFQVTANPWNLACVPGGSSGGSAAAVAAGEAIWALGTDTGGSIRQPASLCSLVGMKPTYGRVSRYGVIAYASSLDQVGPLTRDVRDNALLLGTIAGRDAQDSTSTDTPVPDYTSYLGRDVKGLKAGVVRELLYGEGIEPDVRAAVEAAVAQFEALGIACEEVSLPHSEYSLPTYYIIAPAECSSNLARYDGVRYGHRTAEDTTSVFDMFAKSREEGFGNEVKLRIIKGTYVLSAGYYDAYYKKALQVRTLIKQDFEKAYETCDFLLCPTSPSVAFKIGEKADDPLAMKLADVCTLPINLAGIPAMNVPCGFSQGLPIGMQLMGKHFDEATLYQVAYAYEQSCAWHRQRPAL